MPADPQQIQREIEQTRAELAATVEAIADRVSPKKVASRTVDAAKETAIEKSTVAAAATVEFFAPTTPEPAPIAQRLKYDRVGGAAAAAGLVFLLWSKRITAKSRKRSLRRK